jgi:hypothetical protein
MPSIQQIGLIAVLLAAVVISFVYSRRRSRAGSATPKQYRRELDSASAQGRAVQADMEKLLAEFERLAGRMSEQLDGRHEVLRHSLAEADKRISALRILLDEAKRRLDDAAKQSDADGAAARAGSASPAAPTAAAPPWREVVPPDKKIIAPPAPAASPAGPSLASDAASVSDRHRRIYQLADEGLSATQIAVQLGQPVGEVELILNLRTAVAGEVKAR